MASPRGPGFTCRPRWIMGVPMMRACSTSSICSVMLFSSGGGFLAISRSPAICMNPFKQMAVLREIAKNPPPELKSITEQIDDVLQARIIGTPMIHRGLHVKPGPRGDAIFEADGQSYSAV